MEQLDEKLRTVLSDTFSIEDLDFEISGDFYVSGIITSGIFNEKDNYERQEFVWNILNKELNAEDKQHIVSIITLTPEEQTSYK